MNEEIANVAQITIALIFAFGGVVPLVKKIKMGLNPPPRYTQLILMTVIVIYTIASGIIQDTIIPDSFSGIHFVATFTAILTASQAEYQRIKRAESSTDA